MNFKSTVATLSAMIIASYASPLMAQTTASQKFTVNVPTAVSITAPPNVSITHDKSESDQPFPPQPWVVRGNSLAGVTVSLATSQPFIHLTDPNSKRNAEISLSVNSSQGPAAWTVTQATDATDYAANDGVATVQATSNGYGRATLDVAVSFLTDGFGTFAAGDYETTVTGTVTAN